MIALALHNFLRYPKNCTEKYNTGYEDGLNDAWDYDSGYFDGYYGKSPVGKDDVFYMDGYKDGRNNKKYY